MTTGKRPTSFTASATLFNIKSMTDISVGMLCSLTVFETPGNSYGLATYERMERASHLYTTVRDLGDQTMTSTDVGFHSVFDYTKKKPFVITASKVNIFEQPFETLYSLEQKASLQSTHSRMSDPDCTSHYVTRLYGV
jgi:hypothetical protein